MKATPAPKKKTVNHYVDNDKFYEEISKYHYAYHAAKAAGEPLPRISAYLGSTVEAIATNLGRKPCFSGYSFLDEMIDDAVENCLRYLHSFNPEKSKSPFSYYTQTCMYAFFRRIEDEKKQAYIKYKVMENSAMMNDLVDLSSEDKLQYNSYMSSMDLDRVKDLVDKFEKKKTDSKKGKKQTAVEALIEPIEDESEN